VQPADGLRAVEILFGTSSPHGGKPEQTTTMNSRNALAILLSICIGVAPAVAAQKPNVLLIAVDDLRPELGAYGVEWMKTPQADVATHAKLLRAISTSQP
jgi:hypothetical protein